MAIIDHYLVRDQQIAAAVETDPGVAITLTSAHVKLKASQGDTPFSPDHPRFANDEVAEDIGEAADFVGGKKAGIQVGVLLKTAGVVGTVAAIDPYFQACALKQQIVHFITVGAISPGAAFAEGATYSATGGKTGIIETTRTGAGVLRYIITAGGVLVSTDVVTVGADSATASGTDAFYGVKYTPCSTGQKTITLQRAEKNDQATADKDFLYRLRGAMGNGVLSLAALDAGRFKGDYQGPVDAEANGAFLTGYTYEAGTPPNWVNSTVQLNGEPVQVSEFSLDFGNDVQLEPDPTTVGGTQGFDYARVAKRTPIITINPYRLLVADLDDLGLHAAGTPVPFQLSYGTTPQIVEVVAGLCQIRGWSSADRAGRRVAQLTLNVTRAVIKDNDFSIMFR
jgi:hypothetical protein